MRVFGARRSQPGQRQSDLQQPASTPSDLPASSGAPAESTFRDVLTALRRKDPKRWGAPTTCDEEPCPQPEPWPRLDYSTVAAGAFVVMLSIASGALLLAGAKSMGDGARDRHAEAVSPRLAQIAAAIRAPMLEGGSTASSVQPGHQPVLVAHDSTMEVQSGRRVPLAVHIENVATLESETSLLIHGLPVDARLSEGIMLGPGVWMVRAGLLDTVEIDVGAAPAGRHPLLIELRRPEGAVLSSARVALAVAAPTAQQQEHAPQLQQDAIRPQAPSPAKPAVERITRAAPGKPARKERHVAVTRPAGPKAEPQKSPRKAKPQSEVTILAAPAPIVRPSQSPPKLVWPGDDPRAAYAANPPVFLGGAVPNNAPVSQPAADDNWHKRVFENSNRAQ